MLALCVFITRTLTIVYMELIINLQIFDISQQICNFYIYGRYSRHEMSASSFKF